MELTPRTTVGITALLVLLLDRAAKAAANATLAPPNGRHEVRVVGNFITLRYVENRGIAFGLFDSQSRFAAIAAVLALGCLALAFWRLWPPTSHVQAMAAGMIVGGAIGNLIDRFWRGSVVDFVDVGRWPVFNVADAALTTGFILLVFASVWQGAPARTDAR